MSRSYSNSFTIVHAKQLASKVAADLKRMQRFYGKPSDEQIRKYEAELILLLKQGLLKKVTYGYKRNGLWICPSIIYRAEDLIGQQTDDDPGRIPIGCDISGASFSSYLMYSDRWDTLTTEEQVKFEESLPFSRITATEAGIDGYIVSDKHYTSGGKTLNRSTIKKY